MPLTCEKPRVKCQPPRGSAQHADVPAPECCEWCGGEGCEPYEESGWIPCGVCDGTGGPPLVGFDLPRSRTHELRRIDYFPLSRMGGTAGELVVTMARKATHRPTVERYQIAEADCDGPGRSFMCAKASDRNRLHNVYVGPDAVTCTCEGETYLASAKANQRAWEEGDEIYPTFGCKHTDSVVALLLGGWFNLNVPDILGVT